jgi:acyl carrier protein
MAEVVASIRGAVTEHHELQVHAVVLTKTGSIPKTSSGKIQRRATRDAYTGGILAAVATDVLPAGGGKHDTGSDTGDPGVPAAGPGEAETERVLSIVRDFVRRRGRSEPARFGDCLQGDLGLDSLAVAELLIEVEVAFEVRLNDSVIGELQTVDDVCSVVRKASQGGQGDPSAPVGIGDLQDRIVRQIPQLGVVVSEQEGRYVKIDGRWYSDFASANYLGLDLHPTVLASIPDAIERWGGHPSWTRAVASP